MKYFSMFSGIGGFELGIQQVMPEAECVGFSEIDKYAISVYKNHFKGYKNYGDATKIIPGSLPDFDCLVGGFPCQAFSIAGKRQGFSDTRGTLFFEIARIAREKQPRLLVLENVKGLLSHDEGRSAAVILSTLNEIGYDVQWDVRNSKNHGVPQNRERLFIIGHLRASGQSAREILAFRKSGKKVDGLSSHQANTLTARYGQAIGTGSYIGRKNEVIQLNQSNLKSNSGTQPYCQDHVYDPFGLSPTLNKFVEPEIICYNAGRGLRDKDTNPNRGGGSGMLSRDDGICYSLTKTNANHMIQIIGGQQASRVYDPSGIAPAQQASAGGGGAKTGLFLVPIDKNQNGVLTDYRIRKLMPIEGERLQGFPENWTAFGEHGEKISDSQRYKACGNAVTTNVVASVFRELLENKYFN